MKHYTGLDVSLKTTAICIVNQDGNVIFEDMVPTDPTTIFSVIEQTQLAIEKVAIESGSISHWLEQELCRRGLPIVCIDAHKMSKVLSIKINKNDKNDARLIAEALRCNFYSAVPPKSQENAEIQILIHSRRSLKNMAHKLKNTIRGHLKTYGIFLGSIGNKRLCERVHGQIEDKSQEVKCALHGLLSVFSEIMNQLTVLEDTIETYAKADEDVKLLQTIPGVGILTALSFKILIGDPKRFKTSKTVGAYFGMTSRQYSSGETNRQGRVSKRGSSEMRFLLNEAATVMMYRTKSWCRQKAWGLRLKKKKGHKKAAMALGRKLGIVMHRMLITRKPFEFGVLREPEVLKQAI